MVIVKITFLSYASLIYFSYAIDVTIANVLTTLRF